MGMWAEIKFALNSTLGRNLKPLDRIIAEAEHDNYYHSVANNILINGDGGGKVVVIGENTRALFDFTIPNKSTAIEYVISNTTSASVGIFANCLSLERFRIPTTWGAITSRMFENCSNLKYLDIHDYVTEIYGLAFNGCSALGCIDIGSGVKKIYAQAFNGANNLTAYYNGTQSQWNTIEKEDGWNGNGGLVAVVCTDGTISY